MSDFQHSTNLSVYAVQEAFKSLDSWPGTQLDLWAVWSQITWLTELARVPTFPINPDKIALLLSVYVDLPCSKVVRELIRHRQTLLEPDQVLLLLHGMEIAGKASKDFWPDKTSFLRKSSYYDSTAVIRSLVRFVTPSLDTAPSLLSSSNLSVLSPPQRQSCSSDALDFRICTSETSAAATLDRATARVELLRLPGYDTCPCAPNT